MFRGVLKICWRYVRRGFESIGAIDRQSLPPSLLPPTACHPHQRQATHAQTAAFTCITCKTPKPVRIRWPSHSQSYQPSQAITGCAWAKDHFRGVSGIHKESIVFLTPCTPASGGATPEATPSEGSEPMPTVSLQAMCPPRPGENAGKALAKP